ncbi:hypothetical protein ACRXCV_00435 (plasmid) [Halobacteriovorax sp. GFR7]|uniref:hypothetical protein n=1 Tax=unclassified Halobacteriovorax TaxID=2639665 RepID=UPI003D997075
MAETTGVAELIVRVKDEATKQVSILAKVLKQTLDPDQWKEVQQALEDLGVEIGDISDNFADVGKAAKTTAKDVAGAGDGFTEFSQTVGGVGESTDEMLKSIREAIKGTNSLDENMGDVGQSVRATGRGFSEAADAMEGVARPLEDVAENAENVQENFDDAAESSEELADNLNDVEDELKDLDDETEKTRKRMRKFKDDLDDVGDVADAVGGNIGGITGQASQLLVVLGRVNPVLIGIGTALTVAFAGFKAANDVGNYAKELKNLSAVANTSTQDLQRFAAGGERVGFDLKKSADVLKDFNDRIGDMLSGAGGSLQDYFDALGESVSFTARELQQMETLEALQAVQNDLEKSNLPLEQQIFLWESISGEASKLLPIIRDNGKALKEFGDAAEERGAILSDEEIADALRFNRAITDLGKALETLWRRIGVAILPLMEDFVDLVKDVSASIGSVNKVLRDGIDDWDDWKKAIIGINDLFGTFSANGIAAEKVRDAILGVDDANQSLAATNLKKLTDGYNSAEDAVNKIRSRLAQMKTAEELIKQRLDESNLSRTKQQKLQDDLAEAQQAIIDLTAQEGIAVEKVLQAKLALDAAQKAYNESLKEGQETEITPVDPNGGVNGLVLQELLDGYKAQLAEFYTDTGKTLEARLGAAANATFLNYKSVITRIKQLGGEADLVNALINQETARKQFDILSAEFDRVSEDVELRAEKLGRQVASGIITEATAQEELRKIYGDTGATLDGLLERMQKLAEQTGSQELAQQVEVLRGTVEQFKADLGNEGFIRPEWLESLVDTREKIQDIKNELNLNGVTIEGLDAAMESAVEDAVRPLNKLKEKIQDELSGIELDEANLAIEDAIDVAAVDARLGVLQDLFDTRVDAFNAILSSISLAQEQNLITEAEAINQIKAAYQSMRPEIASVVEAMQTLANESGSQVLKTRVQELANQFTQLEITVDNTTKSMVDDMLEAGAQAAGSGFAQAITDIATEAKSLGDAFKDVMKGILQSMLEVVQSVVAKQFANLILGAVAGGAGGGFGAGVGFADGGYVRGAGTTKSDSIRAWLSDKEFVQPADATAYYGVQFMEMLRRKMIPRELLASLLGGTRSMPIHRPRTPRFSSGGFVSGDVLSTPDGGARGSDLNVTLVQVKDDNEAQAFIQSRRGQGELIQFMDKNKTKIKNLLQ